LIECDLMTAVILPARAPDAPTLTFQECVFQLADLSVVGYKFERCKFFRCTMPPDFDLSDPLRSGTNELMMCTKLRDEEPEESGPKE